MPSAQNSYYRRRVAPGPYLAPGAPPGTLAPLPDSPPAKVIVRSLTHGALSAPQPLEDLTRLPQPREGNNECFWVRVIGLGDLAPLVAMSKFYGIQNMALEDILSPGWRSKLELMGDYHFFVLQAPPISPPPGARGPDSAEGPRAETRPGDILPHDRRSEHLVVCTRENLIITFENTATAVIDSLWQRLEETPLPARVKHTAAFLSYALLDIIIDRFFPLLNAKDESLADLEDGLANVPDRSDLNRLHMIKRQLLTLRRLLAPYRELGMSLRQLYAGQGFTDLKQYMSDLMDHITQAEELVEAYHDIAKSLDDIYQSALSNRMNDIIKILTIISTIFMPLSFLAGVYGMNFNPQVSPWNMPELNAYFGYPTVLLVMGLIVGGMLWFFRRKKWL